MPTRKLRAACDSYLKVRQVLDEFLKLKKGISSSNRVVLALMREHMQLHKLAYGTDWIKPKHHFAFHNALSWQQDEVWLDCFVHERKHQVLKDAASAIDNTTNYEASVLGRAILQQWRQLQDCTLSDCLLGKAGEEDSISAVFGEAVRATRSLQYQSLVIGVGDIVLVGNAAYLVRACVFFWKSDNIWYCWFIY